MYARARTIVREGYRALLDLLFPVTCVSCGTEGSWLCNACVTVLPKPVDTCGRCGRTSLHGITCATCRPATPLAGLASAGAYRDPVLREAVRALKFEGIRELASPLGALLAGSVARTLGASLPAFTVTALPLHLRRERSRGYNQSALLAGAVAEKLRLPSADLLVRTRATSAQTAIAAEFPDLRRNNIYGAFQLRPTSAVPTHVVLVDDVATTGATLEEAARVLYDHGAREIWGAVICRG